jgi:hypothetical protein
VSGFLPTILWEVHFFNDSGSYKTGPIYLEPNLELNSRPLDRTLLLEIFHPKENLRVHIFSNCRGPCDYLRSSADRAS